MTASLCGSHASPPPTPGEEGITDERPPRSASRGVLIIRKDAFDELPLAFHVVQNGAAVNGS